MFFYLQYCRLENILEITKRKIKRCGTSTIQIKIHRLHTGNEPFRSVEKCSTQSSFVCSANENIFAR